MKTASITGLIAGIGLLYAGCGFIMVLPRWSAPTTTWLLITSLLLGGLTLLGGSGWLWYTAVQRERTVNLSSGEQAGVSKALGQHAPLRHIIAFIFTGMGLVVLFFIYL